MAKQVIVPGSVYSRNGRWWWKVKFPGEQNYQMLPLRPPGSKFATKNKEVALEIAREKYERHLRTFQKTFVDQPRTVSELTACYLPFTGEYYSASEANRINQQLSNYLQTVWELPIEDFGIEHLQQIRVRLIGMKLARSTINQAVGTIVRLFKWGAGQGLVDPSLWQRLKAIDGIRRGRPVFFQGQQYRAKETEPVRPVDWKTVEATLSYLSPVLADMICLEWIVGWRINELTSIRPADVETKEEVWIYRPRQFKNQWRGEIAPIKELHIGPRAQAILRPYLLRPAEMYCFRPEESEQKRRAIQHANRTTPLSYGNRPGTNRKGTQTFKPCYDKNSFRRAIHRAAKAAQKVEKTIPLWTPYQLRHAAATRIRTEAGIEAARLYLGHNDMDSTLVYAEVELSKKKELAKMYG
ncbi:MAG: site-specific integrase [Sedimentisphaerales bacterium]|nr:site-specific integrase [Sedimentisphaerales bacterium]